MFVGSSVISMESKLNFQLHGITLQYDSRKQQCNDKPTTSKWSNFLHRLMNTTLHYIITHWKLLLPSPGEQIVSLTCNQQIHSKWVTTSHIIMEIKKSHKINPLKPELNPICYLLALLGAHHFLHVSRIRVKLLTFRRLMSCIYGAPILDVSRSHTTTQHIR